MISAKDEANAKWITIHPGGNGKGSHIKIDGKGHIVAGNPHLVNAIEAKNSSVGISEAKEDEWKFEPPTDEFAGMLDAWKPADPNEFGSLLTDDDGNGANKDAQPPHGPKNDGDEKGLEAAQSVKTARTSFDFGKAVSGITHGEAVASIKSRMCKFLPDALAALAHLNYAMKKSKVRFGSEATRKQGAINFAVAVDQVSKLIREDAIDWKKTSFVPCLPMGANGAFVRIPANGDDDRQTFFCAPMRDNQREIAKLQAKAFKESGAMTYLVLSKFPPSDFDYVTICHEVAHAIYHQKHLVKEWCGVVMQVVGKNGFSFKKDVSQYAWSYSDVGERINEAHSECFAMMCQPSYKPGTLPQPIEDYFRKFVFREGWA